MAQFLIGCDPELFVRDVKGNLVAATGLVPGDKNSPHRVEKGAIQVDGLALEFNIDPVSTFEEFNNNIVTVLRQLKAALPKGYSFDIVPSRQFDRDYYEGLSEEAKELGCDPDFCAYTGEVNPRPDGDSGLRSAAGHIHIGWGENIPVDHPDHLEICKNLVKHLDLLLGLGMMLIDPDDTRRQLYGKAGAFRPKSYGVEYRTPSNVWIRSKTYRKFVWDVIQIALRQMQNGVRHYKDSYGIAQEAINTGNRATARAYFNAFTNTRIAIPAPCDLEARVTARSIGVASNA